MAKEKEQKQSKYGGDEIVVLEGLEPVRKRPGMYIGSTGPDGLNHLMVEIFDNSRDEAMNGFCDEIEVAILPGNMIRVVDNGRGIPVEIHKKTKVSTLETVMTVLHAGGKFEGDSYKISGGLHGVGASVVNALSTWLKAEVHKDGGKYVQEYKTGKKQYAVKKAGPSKAHGTIITFQPDDTIFSETVYDWERVVNHLRGQAYLVKDVRIRAIDARGYEGKIDLDKVFWLKELGLEVPSRTFYFEGGLVSLIKFYNQHEKPIQRDVFFVEKEANKIMVEVALQYIDDIDAKEVSYTNNTITPEGGMHVTGFRTALTRTLNDYGRKNGILKDNDDNFTGDDVREGMTAVISVKMRDPQFEGQTKGKLGSVDARGAVESVFGEAFAQYLEEHPEDAKAIVGKSILAQKARKAAKAAKDSILRKGALEGMTLPGKLADCQSRDAEEAEIFIVEGDSAGGCFDGETRVALTDGRDLSFKKLVEEDRQGKKNYCYTLTDDGRVTIELIKNPRLTKKQADVINIVLDNQEEILCTPDHKFRLANGSYVEARNLDKSMSLAPLYRQFSKKGGRITIDGYEMVWDGMLRHWIFTHLLADEYNLKRGIYSMESGSDRHHKDFNKLNNSPDNLVRMGKGEHLEYHRQTARETILRPEVQEKLRQLRQTPAYQNKVRQTMLAMAPDLSARAKKQWSNSDYKEFMKNKFLQFYSRNVEYRESNKKRLNQNQQRYWSESENRDKQSDRVKRYFAEHPEQKELLRNKANEEWSSEELKKWRSTKTKEQWTLEFRQKRATTYAETYYRHSMSLLKKVFEQGGSFEDYEKARTEKRNNNLLKLGTLAERFFGSDFEKMQTAGQLYNHKVVRIEKMTEKRDVYDLEVDGTHNFALASGVFVHNSAKQGRDRRIQAILPLKGKILNVEKARLDKMLAFAEIKALIIAMGVGIGDQLDVSKLRYYKIIIATDADVDGAHIRTLLLTFFFRYYPQLIDQGRIFIAQPPLYKLKKGKEQRYAYSDEEKDKYVKEMGGEAVEVDEEAAEGEEVNEEAVAKKASKISIQRYKGLGEMNPDELWETTMRPETRVLKQVHVDDVEKADQTFDVLMGSEVEPRKIFIQTHAKLANLDV
jgi:DNA gyrase subunit B